MKILVIGPHERLARGGMASVIRGIRESETLNREFDIHIFPSYIDGNPFVRFFYSVYRYFCFLLCYRKYDLFHINTAERGSTFRKNFYLRKVKKAGKAAILHIHAAEYSSFYDGLGDRGRRVVDRFFRRADLVLALSESLKGELESRISFDTCRVLNNGVDVAEFRKAATDVTEHADSFLMLGRLGERKGVYDLIDAAELAVKENPRLKICLAGDGEVEKVRALVARKGLKENISVPGWLGGALKLKYLKNAATVVLPSYHEAQPVSILEGMAAGKAVIGTVAGAVPEVIGAENGILVEPGDVKGLAEALLRCSTDTEMLKSMSRRNAGKAESLFDVARMHARLAEYYRQAAKRKGETEWSRENRLSA